jgi:hypothetical protein
MYAVKDFFYNWGTKVAARRTRIDWELSGLIGCRPKYRNGKSHVRCVDDVFCANDSERIVWRYLYVLPSYSVAAPNCVSDICHRDWRTGE